MDDNYILDYHGAGRSLGIHRHLHRVLKT
jgi:hypothetical protein